MKKTVFLVIAALAIVSCTKNPGSFSGNVFYKFNDFVGNKPDAGSAVKLYNVDKGAEPAKYEAITDVQGNYKIENVAPADYLLFIQSKNTTAKLTDIVDQLVANSKEVKDVFGASTDGIKTKNEELKAIAVKMDKAYANAMEHASETAVSDGYIKEYGELIKEKEEKTKAILSEMPKELQAALAITEGTGPKVELKKVQVEEAKNAQNNTDFGITYK
jgi:hypothetical protein